MDVLRLVVAGTVVLIVLVVEWLFGDTLVAFASDLLRGLDAVPHWIVTAFVIGTRILGVIVLGGGLAWIVHRRRWRMLLTVAIAGGVAVAITSLLGGVIDTDPGRDLVELGTELGPLTSGARGATAAIAAVAAMLTAAAPWLDRRARRAGWALIIGLVVTAFIQAPVSFDPVVAWIVGWLCGAAVLVVGGAPSRRPTIQAVIAGLGAVGLPVERLERAGVDARGSTPYLGVGVDGTKLFVKALGSDERSADQLFRVYRRLQPHDLGDEKPFSSLRRSVEHEAFVALTASALGVRTPALRAVATADPNGYVLAYEAIDGKSLDRLDPDDVTDDVLDAVWDLVGQLHDHRIAHRDLRLANVFLDDDGQAWLIDFGFSEVAASDLLLATDVAELLASSSADVGSQRAVARAAAAVDPSTLAAALDRLHRWALSGATRTALEARPGALDDLRDRLAAAIGGITP
ncbi:MAG: lipopolysaccharide kinase InaA family protein [Ilumatobacteraceae bacterium]